MQHEQNIAQLYAPDIPNETLKVNFWSSYSKQVTCQNQKHKKRTNGKRWSSQDIWIEISLTPHQYWWYAELEQVMERCKRLHLFSRDCLSDLAWVMTTTVGWGNKNHGNQALFPLCFLSCNNKHWLFNLPSTVTDLTCFIYIMFGQYKL